MITKLDKKDWTKLIPFLKKNILENYFNILGLLSDKEVYKDIYVQYSKSKNLESVLFVRKSGNIKFYSPAEFNFIEISDFLQTIDFKAFIGPASYSNLIPNEAILTKSKKITDLCYLKSKINLNADSMSHIAPINIEYLDELIEIYKKSFKSFASKEMLKLRFQTKRGRTFGIFEDKRLVSVAGTDFETDDEALIVGVATMPDYRNRGYGTDIVKYLSNLLENENKQVYLEYEDSIAGNIYNKLGYCIIDSVYKYWD